MSKQSATTPRYQASVFFVENIQKSTRFYSEVLGQKVVQDFGANVTFEGGLSLWEKEYALNVIFEGQGKQIPVGANNSEIYFESSDIDAFYERLVKEQVRVIHPVMEHPWGQRGFRVYDPDNHILEFGEPMSDTVLRLHKQGLSVDEVAKKSMMPLDFIHSVLQTK
ncbi:MAG: VOC family protein [Candidatus Bathyarchaeia archaeon]|jgi:catechol 2,3-dioxygenase-like lactoylglutathione lyase family enzyme